MSETTLIFKIKTTTPDNYVVKPNMAVLSPQKETKISVGANFALDSDKEVEAIKKDKFQVQILPLSQPLQPD